MWRREGEEGRGGGRGRVSRESLEHEYWKRYYARLYEQKGYKVTLEAPRRHGRVDVLAVRPAESEERAGESVAIEVETGKSDVVWNVKQDLLMGWKVMVVATSRKESERIERELAKVGLIVPGRVEVMMVGKTE